MDFRHTYPDYVALIADRRPQKHSEAQPVRPPRKGRGWRR